MLKGLGPKTLLVLFIVAGAYTALSWAVLERVIRPAFDELERAAVVRDLDRVRHGIDSELRHLLATAGDWANWDETRAFVEGDGPGYVAANLDPSVYENLGVAFFYFYDREGRSVFARAIDPATGAEFTVAGFEPEWIRPGHPLLDRDTADGTVSGLVAAADGGVLVVSRPIRDSSASGEPVGTLVMGRLLDAAAVADLRDRAQVDVRLLPIGVAPAAVARRLEAEGAAEIVEETVDRLLAYAPLAGLDGRPALFAEVGLERDIAAVGGRTIDLAVGLMLVAVAAYLLVVWLLLHRLIVGPIRRLTRHIAASERGAVTQRLDWRRDDEIGTLAGTYDRLSTASREQVDALHRAMERLTAADAAKTSFFANMSHELRTPLNAIIGFSDVMRTQLLGPLGSERYREYAGDINASGQHLLRLVNQILDLSKAESEQLELALEDVDLADCIDGAVRMMRLQAEHAGIEIERRVESELPMLRADRLRLSEVLLNLMSNAVKFTDPGGCVTVSAWRSADGRIGIRVADTGIGMSADDIPRALAPFVQLENGRMRTGTGTGLGLPLAKRLTELHGGTFVVLSTVGQGTTVTLTFPPRRRAPEPRTDEGPPGGRAGRARVA